MPDRASIALACLPGERASLVGWLTESGYEPLAIPDLSRLDDVLQSNAVEALIADLGLTPREDQLWDLVRRLGSNRPLVMLGDAKRLPSAMLGDLSVVPRPLTREALVLTVGLALAEGRPARKFPRRVIEPIAGTAHGVAVTVREASLGGVGLEMTAGRTSVLPPYFDLRIPEFGVHVVVKRAWMAPVGPELTRCGGTVEGDLPGHNRSWADFVREAPAPVSHVMRRWSTQ
jgi:hypothetical protein